MSDKPENPSAFPREDYQADRAPGQSGMTLRDYFAGQALIGLIRCPIIYNNSAPATEYAALAYKTADAMLKVREAS